MQTAPYQELSPRPKRSTRALIVAGLLLGAVLLAGGAMLARMSFVPANLDYSTTRPSNAGLFSARYTSSVNPVPVNQLHSWTLHLETPAGQPLEHAQIGVDGDMPQHGHGLPTRPQVTQNLGHGDYLVEGLKFQMGGWWVMDFKVTAGGQTDTVRFNLLLGK